jgi:hypothetical protein
MLKWILFATVAFQIYRSERAMKWEVEIFLLESSGSETGEASFEQNYMDDSKQPFIQNSEILGYEIVESALNHEVSYYMVLSDTGKDKIGNLSIPVCCGRYFMITVNRKPVLEGYFWRTYSSYACDFLTIEVPSSNNFEIRNGYPKQGYFGNFPDPRRNHKLLQAFSKTKRLLRI